jgi:beta-mannanase
MGKPVLPLPGQIMTGVSLGNQPLDAFERDAGKKVSLMLDYQAWGSTDGTQYFPVSWANSVRQHGSIPVIAWEPWVPGVYPQDVNQPTYALKNIIAGKFDAYIHQWALAAKNWRGPFFLRFAPEMNGNWTPWSENVNGNAPGEFVQTWRHVYNIFKVVNATNVTWVWNPNLLFRAKGALPLSEFYPGNDYVDWTALDGFNAGRVDNKGRWDTFSHLFQPSYSEILTFSPKPMMIAETGSVEQGGSKAAWITDAFSTELPKKFPDIKAFAWFNHMDTKQDWRIETSPGSQAAFAEAMRSPLYASNDFANYLGG